MDVPTLRPLAIGEVVDVAIKIYRTHFVTLIKIVVFVVAPVAVLSAFITASAPLDVAVPDTGPLPGTTPPPVTPELPDASALAASAAAVLVATMLNFLAAILATGACFKAVSQAYLGESAVWSDSLRFALRRLGSLAWLSILTGVLTLFAFLAFIVPGVWLFVAWSIAIPVLLFEGVRGTGALGRSYRLVRNRWWPTATELLLAYILVLIVSAAITGALLGTIFAGVDETGVVGVLLNALASTVSSTLTTPFLAAVVTVIYFDLRVRKEGFDIELLARGLGTTIGGQGELDERPPSRPSDEPGSPGWERHEDRPPGS